jgi:hypothetical protein
MGEVEDVNFQGIAVSPSVGATSSSETKDTTFAGSFKYIWEGLIDDLQGKK